MKRIGVIGAGSWGTALAQCLACVGKDVTLWAREPDVVLEINEKHENTVFLPGIPLNEDVIATESISMAAKSDVLLVVTPAQFVRQTLETLKGEINAGVPVVICSKGIELNSGLLMSQVAMEVDHNLPLAIMTGPTFASEVAKGLPAAVTISSANKDVAARIAEEFSSKSLRPYITDDLLGSQIGGAVKNVIAIASGVIMGKNFGENAKAALVTRGLAEMARLASAMGAKRETLMGMCGMGDLMLTCSSMQSRNFSLGMALGEGQKMEDIMRERGAVVTEGVPTAAALMTMARKNAVEMPIAHGVNMMVNEGKTADEIIGSILERPLRESEAA